MVLCAFFGLGLYGLFVFFVIVFACVFVCVFFVCLLFKFHPALYIYSVGGNSVCQVAIVSMKGTSANQAHGQFQNCIRLCECLTWKSALERKSLLLFFILLLLLYV